MPATFQLSAVRPWRSAEPGCSGLACAAETADVFPVGFPAMVIFCVAPEAVCVCSGAALLEEPIHCDAVVLLVAGVEPVVPASCQPSAVP